jgi:hypothetical protein
VVGKLEAAREMLSHAIPGATMEQVLEAALDLLLEKQARARGQVKRPRTAAPAPSASATVTAAMEAAAHPPSEGPPSADVGPEQPLVPTEPPPPRRTGPREPIPAAVRRAVWERDQGRCQWPLDSGGCCGSTHQLELDHLLPWARWGPHTVDGLRLLCHAHNLLAARQVFGARCMERYAGGRRTKRKHDATSIGGSGQGAGGGTRPEPEPRDFEGLRPRFRSRPPDSDNLERRPGINRASTLLGQLTPCANHGAIHPSSASRSLSSSTGWRCSSSFASVASDRRPPSRPNRSWSSCSAGRGPGPWSARSPRSHVAAPSPAGLQPHHAVPPPERLPPPLLLHPARARRRRAPGSRRTGSAPSRLQAAPT